MALISTVNCKQCGETKREVNSLSPHASICNSCIQENEDRDRRVYLAGLKGLTMEERLDKIEEALYDLNAENRIKSLESRLATY